MRLLGYLLTFLLSCAYVSHIRFGVISSDKRLWSKFLADVFLLHPPPCPPFGLQQSCYQRHKASPPAKAENLIFTFIHSHYQLPSDMFLFLFSGQGIKELLYKRVLVTCESFQ